MKNKSIGLYSHRVSEKIHRKYPAPTPININIYRRLNTMLNDINVDSLSTSISRNICSTINKLNAPYYEYNWMLVEEFNNQK